jgi:hypothetical protein
MHRRSLRLPALLVVAAIAVGACGGSTPALSDPGEILTKAVESMQKAKTVHVEATVDGTLSLDLTGTGQAGEVTLTGTKLTADIDIKDSNLEASLAVPAILGLTADVIVVGDDTYTRTSMTGDKYQKSSTSGSGLPVDATDPEQSLKDLQEWLKKPEVGPQKLDDASCGSESCYQVKIDLTADELGALIPEAAGLGSATVALTILVEKDSLHPSRLTFDITAAELGDLTLTLSFSKWDESLDISAPPADEVQ